MLRVQRVIIGDKEGQTDTHNTSDNSCGRQHGATSERWWVISMYVCEVFNGSSISLALRCGSAGARRQLRGDTVTLDRVVQAWDRRCGLCKGGVLPRGCRNGPAPPSAWRHNVCSHPQRTPSNHSPSLEPIQQHNIRSTPPATHRRRASQAPRTTDYKNGM